MPQRAVFRATCLFMLATTVARPAFAQQPEAGAVTPTGPANGRATGYDAAFFAPFAPRTALDIARRVPGFSLELGGNDINGGDVRGFAGAAGNVVINGARPSAKSETLEATLARIPASRVQRVEVAAGDLYGSDYAGKTQVLNVILSAEGGFDATVTASANRAYTGYINTDIQGTALLRRGAHSFNLSAGTGRNKQFEEGTDTQTDAETGELLVFRRKHNSYFNRDPFISGSWSLEHGSDDAFRLNARWQPSSFDLFQRNRVTPAVGAAHDDNLTQRYRRPVIELGGDVTRPLGGGALKLVGLATRRKRDDLDIYVQRDGLLDEGGQVNGGSEFSGKAKRNETIGRLSWTHPSLFGLSFEAGAEAALNTLDSRTSLVLIGEDGERTPIDLPLDDAKVKETRGEIYVRAGKNLSPSLRLDAGTNYEFSDLKVSGDTSARRRLKFLKPNMSLDWKPGKDWHTRLSIRRTVAQLDFYDFISVAELSTDRVNAGNENLEPQRTWEYRLTADRKILGDGLIKLDLGHDRVSMLQDRILICEEDAPDVCFDAPGNIGAGRRTFASLEIDTPLAKIWDGFRVKGNVTIQKTRVEDPISGKMRKFSGFFPTWNWFVELRRDKGAWSYGGAISDRAPFTFYRTDELDENYNDGPYATLFVEHRLSPKTAIRFDVDNLLNTLGGRRRTLFNPNRADPLDIRDEVRERNRHRSFGLTLKQSFGGGVAKN